MVLLGEFVFGMMLQWFARRICVWHDASMVAWRVFVCHDASIVACRVCVWHDASMVACLLSAAKKYPVGP
jgi:hypothetical protein